MSKTCQWSADEDGGQCGAAPTEPVSDYGRFCPRHAESARKIQCEQRLRRVIRCDGCRAKLPPADFLDLSDEDLARCPNLECEACYNKRWDRKYSDGHGAFTDSDGCM